MPGRLERHVTLAADRPNIIVADKGDDALLEDLRHEGGSPPRVTAVAEDADDHINFVLTPGHWPRVFPGL
jgi:hypothetical protein